MQQVRNESKEAWGALSPEDRQSYKDAYDARMLRRRQGEQQRQSMEAQQKQQEHDPDDGLGCSSRSPWGGGSAKATIHPKLVQRAFQEGQRLPSLASVFDEREYFVADEFGGEFLGDGVVIEGCPLQGRNACKQESLSWVVGPCFDHDPRTDSESQGYLATYCGFRFQTVWVARSYTM